MDQGGERRRQVKLLPYVKPRNGCRSSLKGTRLMANLIPAVEESDTKERDSLM
jgi:hypothetical protein